MSKSRKHLMGIFITLVMLCYIIGVWKGINITSICWKDAFGNRYFKDKSVSDSRQELPIVISEGNIYQFISPLSSSILNIMNIGQFGLIIVL